MSLDPAACESLFLRNKSGEGTKEFSLFEQQELNRLANSRVEFDISKLEIEYDYDTDAEQIKASKKFLEADLYYAIDFFVKEDPLALVENFAGTLC